MLPDVTFFEVYHFVTRLMISPAPRPIGAPSIRRKRQAATTHQRRRID
jgi:hypothetical protein